jgi:hypothetical protein
MTILEKSNTIGTVFMDGIKAQFSQQWTWGSAAIIGLYQGLKYKGDIKAGISGGVAVLIVLTGANGIYNVISHWSRIKQVLKEREE